MNEDKEQLQEWVKQAGILTDADQLDDAMVLCHKVLSIDPDNYKALFCAGTALMKAGRNTDAEQLMRRVIEIRPRDYHGWHQLAAITGQLYRVDECVRFAEKALALERNATTLSNAAYARTISGEWDLAEKYAVESIKLDHDFLDPWVHMAYIALAKRDWAHGWPAFKKTQRTAQRKEWQYGDSVEWNRERDAVVITTGEQGLGDEIMAAQVVPEAAQDCKMMIFDCDHRLHTLFRRSFPSVVVVPTRREKTVHLPVMPTHHKTLFGLCEFYRMSDAAFPRKTYLAPDERYMAMFRALLASLPNAQRGVTGIAWSGGFPRTGESSRRMGLEAFLPLFRQGGEFVSLQYKDDAAEVLAFERKYHIKVHRFPWVTQAGDMDLLAGLIAALDRVTGVHTTALHLSSALGVPTTILTFPGSGWRYAPPELLWYPNTTRLFKRAARESWRECMERLVNGRELVAA